MKLAHELGQDRQLASSAIIAAANRRAVLLIYFWSALLAFGGVAMSIIDDPLRVLSVVAALAAIAIVLSSVPRLRASRRVP